MVTRSGSYVSPGGFLGFPRNSTKSRFSVVAQGYQLIFLIQLTTTD